MDIASIIITSAFAVVLICLAAAALYVVVADTAANARKDRTDD